jgi:hypothetical protein
MAVATEHGCFNVSDPASISWARFLVDLRDGICGRGGVLDLPYILADAIGTAIEAPLANTGFAARLMKPRSGQFVRDLITSFHCNWISVSRSLPIPASTGLARSFSRFS